MTKHDKVKVSSGTFAEAAFICRTKYYYHFVDWNWWCYKNG